jgi:hypothetical protein
MPVAVTYPEGNVLIFCTPDCARYLEDLPHRDFEVVELADDDCCHCAGCARRLDMNVRGACAMHAERCHGDHVFWRTGIAAEFAATWLRIVGPVPALGAPMWRMAQILFENAPPVPGRQLARFVATMLYGQIAEES